MPWLALIALLLGPFAFSTGAFVFGGLLEPMAADLGVSVNTVAQLQTAFAISCAVGGPTLALVLRRVDRRRTLISVALVLALIHMASALVPSFGGLLFLRILGGFIGALTVPLASTLAVALVPPEQRGRALAMVFGGTALALLVGIPTGSMVGGLLGWQASLWYTALLSAVVAGLIAFLVPPPTGAVTERPPRSAASSVIRWPLTGLYAVTFLAFSATFAPIGLIGPIITAMTGLTGGSVGSMQILVGIGSLLGLVIGARLADGPGIRVLLPLFAIIAATRGVYVTGLALGATGPLGLTLFALATVPGAAALFACFPVIAASVARIAGPSATLAFALNGATVFLGQGIGIALGGLGFAVAGLPGAAVSGLILGLAGMALAARVSTTADRPS